MFGISDEVTLRLTDAEVEMLSAWATVRARADSGDRKARQKLAQLERRVAALTRSARRGNAKAKRELAVLTESGILERSQSIAMNGVIVL